ncbi:MAG TPA: LuxR C-terminal-related transcriptional regulator [Ferruginibacter sp.]|nr:LuxR C-terminal-related transcriptional regulator [Ferruginibacter sp.]
MIKNSIYKPTKKKNPDFSEKELVVVRLICQEYSNREIAGKMRLSKRTVEGYRVQILEKMRARNTAGIVVYALRNEIYR